MYVFTVWGVCHTVHMWRSDGNLEELGCSPLITWQFLVLNSDCQPLPYVSPSEGISNGLWFSFSKTLLFLVIWKCVMKLEFLKLLVMYMGILPACMSVTHRGTWYSWKQEGGLGFPGIRCLWATKWELGIKPGFSGRGARPLSILPWIHFSSPETSILKSWTHNSDMV